MLQVISCNLYPVYDSISLFTSSNSILEGEEAQNFLSFVASDSSTFIHIKQQISPSSFLHSEASLGGS